MSTSTITRTATRTTVGALSAALVGVALAATPTAQAAITGSANYTCVTPIGDVTVPVAVVGAQVPASAPAGLAAPAGLLAADVDITIPASLGDTLLFFGLTKVGGSSTDFGLGLGSTSLTLAGVATEPVTIVQGQDTLLHAEASNGAFTTPAAGSYAVSMPSSFVYTATNQDGQGVSELTCAIADPASGQLGTIAFTKQTSKTTAKPGSRTVKASKKATVKVTVARALGGTATGALVAKIGTKTVAKGKLAKGKASLTLAKLKPGTYTVTVSYAGDASTAASKAKAKIKVVK